jgi:hypothetical protein
MNGRIAVADKDRRAIFAKNLTCLCDSQRGGIEFIAEELTGIKRPDLWEKENWKLGVQDNRKQTLTSAIRRLERWCKEGVVRFDKRTRQDIVKLKTIFKLSSFEDLWRVDLISDLEKTKRKKELEEKELLWTEEMGMNSKDVRILNKNAIEWSHKVWQIACWYTGKNRHIKAEDLCYLIDDLWELIPEEWRLSLSSKQKHLSQMYEMVRDAKTQQ